MDKDVRAKFGKDYMGPYVTPPHKNVMMWFGQEWGQEWLRKHRHTLANWQEPKPTLVYDPVRAALPENRPEWDKDPASRRKNHG
jgi:hypothetical protein